MMKKFAQYIILLVLLALLVGGVLWSNHSAAGEKCVGVRVLIHNPDSFISRDGILHELQRRNIDPIGRPMAQVNVDSIERVLDGCDYMEDVECYVYRNNVLTISARQFVPVMRIQDLSDTTMYYVNRRGKRMLADGRFHADVPVVVGDFHDLSPTYVLPLIDYVEADNALRGLVSMYVVRDSFNVCFVPSIRGHIVNLGTPDGLASKFQKLKLFYDNVMAKRGWDTYTEVTLKWDYQVVGKLRNKRQPYPVDLEADADEFVPPIETVQVPGGEVVYDVIHKKKDDKQQ